MRPPALTHPAAAVFLGDCLDVLAEMPDNSVDAIVTDPPYGLGFMGKAWDDLPPGLPWAQECLRVLKPGGHLLAFGGTRTWHRLAVAVEDAGFEVRDSIAWLYGSGFPKSLDVSKAIDKIDAAEERRRRALEFTAFIRESGLTAQQIDTLTGTNMGGHYTTAASQPCVATAEHFDKLRPHLPEVPARIEELVRQRTVESENFKAREVIGIDRRMNEPSGIVGVGQGERSEIERKITNAHTPAAQQWSGWGTALKPAFEPIVVARKPLIGTVAANVLTHGTGALNIDATRVAYQGDAPTQAEWNAKGRGGSGSEMIGQVSDGLRGAYERGEIAAPAGRWPTNVVMDGDAAEALDEQSEPSVSRVGKPRGAASGDGWGMTATGTEYADAGGPSRFFPVFRYQAKAPTRERPFYFRPSCDCEDAWPTATTSLPKATDGTTEPAASSTSKSGSGSTTAPSPTDTTSTISTTTSSTTTRAISSPSPRPSTSGSTLDANSGTASGGSPVGSVESSSPSASTTGISAAKDGRSTDAAAPVTSREWSKTDVCGSCGAPTRREAHATVKPLALMRWLVRLVTPPGGTVLDPFAGSGATVEAAIQEGFYALGIEWEETYLPLVQVRLDRNPAED